MARCLDFPAGELLKQIEPGKTGPKPELSTAAGTQLSRKDAAEQAATSKRQAVTAIRAANIPDADFDRQVESSYLPKNAVQESDRRKGAS